MPWFLFLDLDTWQPAWPASYLGCQVSLRNLPHLGGPDLPSSFRVSPLFPLAADHHSLSTSITKGTWYLDFACPPNPFRELGRLVTKLESQHRRRLWFSLGTAALVSMSPEDTFEDLVLSLLGDTEPPRERWIVSDGLLHKVETHLPPPSTPIAPRPRPADYAALPPDLRGVIDEFITSLQTLLAPIERSLPDEALVYHSLASEVFEMVDAMLYLTRPDDYHELPSSLSGYRHSDLIGDEGKRIKLLHQLTDRVIQINSALSYVTSQLHSGMPPLLERRCLIRRYSLLGIGTAARALLRVAQHVEEAFREGRVESVLCNLYNTATIRPLPGLVDSYGHNPSHWNRLNVGAVADTAPVMPGPAKVVYFSGRLGFREAEFAISAALQVLWAGDTLEWSPNTLSHELLHGHVRNIISQIFRPQESTEAEQHQSTHIYSRFADAMINHPQEDMTALESIRFVLLSYCCLVPSCGSLTSPPGDSFLGIRADQQEEAVGGLRLYPEPTLWGIFEHQQRNISEIIVHVLDLHYFYRSRLDIYIPFIWRSWAAVPIVIRDLRQYVLRSLLAAASLERGTPRARFTRAVASLRSHISTAGPEVGTSPLIQGVIDYTENSELVEQMFLPFNASLRIVDLARHVLFSSRIRTALYANDDLLEITQSADSETIQYNINELEFQDLPIASPTAFLLDRLQRLMSRGATEPASDRRTAWLLLALASDPR